MFARWQEFTSPRNILRALCFLLFVACASFFATCALAAIPAAERQVLIDFYNSTNGDNWGNAHDTFPWSHPWKTNGSFGAPGTECSWDGVGCNATQTHVTAIFLPRNSLTGTLPATLNQLTALEGFDAFSNGLTGSIPSLTGLTALQEFSVSSNCLTGVIPSLTGLSSLRSFWANNNQLTGNIPSLDGLSALSTFWVNNNQLTGPIPSLGGLTALQSFSAYNNQLTGPIPSLAGPAALVIFNVGNNQLTGNIPSLAGLTALESFDASNNQLTGSIPSLDGPTWLMGFYVANNQLTGSIPSLNGLTALRWFDVQNNQLTGAPPAPPAGLLEPPPPPCDWGLCPPPSPPPGAKLCPNYLTPSADPAINAAWDTAIGESPWYRSCAAAPPPGPTREYTGQWIKDDGKGNNDEDAWGLTVLMNFPGNSRYIFVPWYTYDSSGEASWYLFQGDNWSANDTISTDVYLYTGPNWGAMPYNNSRVAKTKAGTARLKFTSATTAQFEYNVEGSSRSIDLRKFE